MAYVNPHDPDDSYTRSIRRRWETDELLEMRKTDPVLASLASEPLPAVPKGWRRPHGMSPSGAMEPAARSVLLERERLGEIEVRRQPDGQIVAYREVAGE